eukprot:TRINITY_DN17104_c0_g1_i1.p1 TRINITY_DN17104_c0_g1~~TRINITY_DN17104_c0_g1_i1.p1  ORF type:complete len:194 (-),score=33.34 TRINITY_DN17104_c0_g1_i1:46-603(-)
MFATRSICVSRNARPTISRSHVSQRVNQRQSSTLNPQAKNATQTENRPFKIVEMTVEEEQKRLDAAPKTVSPHLTIYAFPLPAITSITHRITGVGLTLGAAGVAGLSLFNPDALIPVMDYFGNSSALRPLAKFLVTFPLAYHTIFGIRHLWWDATAKGLELKDVYSSTYGLFGATAAVTAGVMLL